MSRCKRAVKDDPAARDIIEHPVAERWPFDNRCRVIGEGTITKPSSPDDVTVERRNAATLRYLPHRDPAFV